MFNRGRRRRSLPFLYFHQHFKWFIADCIAFNFFVKFALFFFVKISTTECDKKGDIKITNHNGNGYENDEFIPFTECDHIFDSTERNTQFSLPIIPSFYSSKDGFYRSDQSNVNTEHEDIGLKKSDNLLQGDIQIDPFEKLTNFHEKYFFKNEAKRNKTIKILPNNIQCIYTFIGNGGERVKLEFTHFQLAGTADTCDLEYVDVYSELESSSDDLLSATLTGRYCGTVAPHVRISLHNVLILIFHSRIGKRRSENIRLEGKFEIIPEAIYIPGTKLPGFNKCAFLIEPKTKLKGTILSPTYPGTYPSNFRCVYLLKGNIGDRIRLYFRDFDVYFGGEHCPYDALTVYDGPTNSNVILRKVCGLQQGLEIYSFESTIFLEFNTTALLKNDPRGFMIDYEFSDRFVNIRKLIRGQRGVSHILGTECDIRILSSRESLHYIESPNFPNMYPSNTTCTYILDGLQGDQYLEKVILTFETFLLTDEIETGNRSNTSQSLSTSTAISETSLSAYDSSSELCSSGSFVAISLTSETVRTVLSQTEESAHNVILCGNIAKTSTELGPYTSLGPRIVVVFGSADPPNLEKTNKQKKQYGFRAKVEFKTDFGVPGEVMGDSNKCMFRFKEKRGSFNSPRYPANYPLDTNCTYTISGEPGEQILLHFTQFALFEENSKSQCNDYLEIYDIFTDAKAKHCWTMYPGPTISTFGAYEMRVVFNSNSFGTANGFNAIYEIRKLRKEDVPKNLNSDPRHCGQVIEADNGATTGFFTSPGFPVKYNKDLLCDWEIRARPNHQILLQLTQMIVEGEMTEQKTSCMSAVIVIHLDYKNRSADLAICGTNSAVLAPIVTDNNSIRISFLTSPDKVNGLAGFNFTWTEVRLVKSDSECVDEDHYLCSYTLLCIAASLRCNGDENCGLNDDTDEAHCNIAEKATDMRTILIAATFSGFIFFFIFGFFCFLFKKKLERKKQKQRRVRRNARATKLASFQNGKPSGNSQSLHRVRSGGAPTSHKSHRSSKQYAATHNKNNTSNHDNATSSVSQSPYYSGVKNNPIIMIRPDSKTILGGGLRITNSGNNLAFPSVSRDFDKDTNKIFDLSACTPDSNRQKLAYTKGEQVFFG